MSRIARCFSSATSKKIVKIPNSPSIGFVGLGAMGYPMASSLFKAGSKFTVYDVSESALSRFQSENPKVHIAKNPREVAANSNLIFTMLPTPAHVSEVYLGSYGILSGVKANSVLVDSSTIDPKTTIEVAKEVDELDNVIFMDAPVSGGTLGAAKATLTFMVGSSEESHFKALEPFLKHMGNRAVHCGQIGNGQTVKIINNMLLGVTMIASAEAMNLGVRMGVDKNLLADIINSSSGRCWSMDTYNPCPGIMENVPSSNNYTGGFGVQLMAKDMGLAVSAARDAKSTVTLAAVSHQLYNQISTTPEFAAKDFSVVYKWLNDNSKQ